MNLFRHRRNASVGVLFASLFPSVSAMAQTGLNTVPRFALTDGPLVIRQAVQPDHPFTVTGETGAILGLQNGSVEMWALPTKVFNNLHLTAELAGYSVPIDLNAAAATIDVQPDHTTIRTTTSGTEALSASLRTSTSASPDPRAGVDRAPP